jgi:L-seryl-tRNA(Ser) seleniumtransferase
VNNLFRLLPSVDKLLHAFATRKDLDHISQPLQRETINQFLDLCRQEIKDAVITDPRDLEWEKIASRAAAFVRSQSRPHFRRVLNGTGVVVHTNLGRSILADTAVAAVGEACRHYSNLEFDLHTGKRGIRYAHVEKLLCRLTGAEAALVVNNNAAAVLLILDTWAKGREAIVSRGELVEIGGSFRIPEVMAKSGATLREVGATNRTHVRDYENAITENTAVLMRVHTSNYRIIGFHKAVSQEELVALGHKHDLPVIEDMGSGNFFDFSTYNMMAEPTVQQTVAAGLDVISFSGDKLLGGPQAGIIIGRKKYIDPIKTNQLNRALRIDKMTLAALEATLRLYLDPELARTHVPTLAMITADPAFLKSKARRMKQRLARHFSDRLELTLVPGVSRVGGGAFPEQDLATTLIGIKGHSWSADELKTALLSTDPPLVGRIEDDYFCLDPRTIDPQEMGLVIRALEEAVEGRREAGDGRREAGDGRQETGDRRRETGHP